MTIIPTEVLPSGHMELMTSINPSVSYSDAMACKEELTWRNLGSITVDQALTEWFKKLRTHTRTNYISGMRMLAEKNLINPWASLQKFALANHNGALLQISSMDGWSECYPRNYCIHPRPCIY